MRHHPQSLMIFAAGFGTRMGALTANRPKPLIPVAGQPLIDHALAVAGAAGVTRIVVNLHYLGDQIAAHLAGRDIGLSWEREAILETGGGLRAARPLLGDGPVMVLNSDVVWTGPNPLMQLQRAWRPEAMDALLLLLPVSRTSDPARKGDFVLAPDGRISRGRGGEDHLYIGALITQVTGLDAFPEAAFSLNRLWDRQIAAGRAFGLVHAGGWCDVGRSEGIVAAEAMLKAAHV